jgi:hypothetical protein
VARVTLREGWDWGSLVPTPAACGLGFWIGGGDECESLLLYHGGELDTSNWTEASADSNYSAEKDFRFAFK